MSEQKREIDQLWYTWSDVGLDTIRAGFRVRAASEGLQDVRSTRMQRLDRYQRYFLPQEVDSTIPPEIAPICLALIDTGEERILVHKVYTGKDGIGRYGAFFVHLLAGLPQDFSARDAISLWKSSFWKKSDQSLVDHYETHLDTVSTKQLASMQENEPYTPEDGKKIKTYLPYVIQAYLMKKPLYKDGQKIPYPLYIVGRDDDVAHLITGLTQSLPNSLLKNLTFSTYEHNIFEAPTEIVGTCWLSVPDAEENPLLERLFPSWYAKELLVLNCYTDIRSPLEDNPLLEYKSLANDFAADATGYFLYGGNEFKSFLDDAEGYTDVDSFLALYQKMILNSQNPSQQDIEDALQPQTRNDWKNTTKILDKPKFQGGVIQLAKYKAGWWQEFGSAAIINLRKRGADIPGLMHTLSSLARNAANDAIAMASEKKSTLLATVPGEVEAFKNLTSLIYYALPPEADPEFWTWLLQKMLGIKGISPFFSQHWDIYVFFVSIGCNLLPPSEKNNKLLAPLLTISWEVFGDFLTLNLPLAWRELATRTLVSANARRLDTKTAAFLEKNYSNSIGEFFLILSSHADYWRTLFDLFDRLTKASYPGKMSLLTTLLNSGMGEDAEFAEQLVKIAHLNADEQVHFLILSGPRYLPLFNRMSLVILNMMSELSKENAAAKMYVLFSWLDTPLIATWLSAVPSGENNLATILKRVNLNGLEAGDFLRRYGQVYIQRYPQSSILLDLFEKYAATGDRQSLWNMLNIWLLLPLDQKVLERLLRAAQLPDHEQINFLERYGRYYLQHFPASPVLLQYTRAFSHYLWSVDIYRFQQESSPKEPSNLEQLLYILSQIPHPLQGTWEVWHTIAFFVRDPSLLQTKTPRVAHCADQLLTKYVQRKQIDSCTPLLHLLARGCIKNPDTLAQVVKVFSGIFTPTDLMLLLYEIADCAGESIRMRQQEKALFVPCIASAYTFKKLFLEKKEKIQFLQLFLNILIPSFIDSKTLKWIESEMRRYYPTVSGRWQKYFTRPRYPLPSAMTPSPANRLLLWWENIKAMTRLRLALRSKNMTRLARISGEYMTTLHENIPEAWQPSINTAVQQLNTLEEMQWQQSPIFAPYLVDAANNKIAQQLSTISAHRSASNKGVSFVQDVTQVPPSSERPRIPRQPLLVSNDRQTRAAFMKVQKALRNENIGKIVCVATDHMAVLETYHQQIPPTWWRMLDVAFDFIIACEDAETDMPDQLKEQAIITASENIRVLVEANELAPRLTEHERQRVRTAVQHVARMNIQSMKEADRQWIRATLAATNVPGMEPTVQIRPSKTSLEIEKPGEQGRSLRSFLKSLVGLLAGQRDSS